MFKFLINPSRFNKFSDIILKPLVVVTTVTLIIGLFLVYYSPLDYQQGLTVKIMYIHVPSAWLALLTYAIMTIYSIIGSLILSCLGSISSSMNLLNKTNFSIGSVIVLLFSIPLIIFSVGINNADNNFNSLLNLLIGIALIFLGVAPWSSAACIRLALNNK